MTRIKTLNGFVRGIEHDGVRVFKGVPYAEAPVGDLRFAAPSPCRNWLGERDCRNYGPISLQPIDPLSVMIPDCELNFYSPDARQSEDCLNLNVWTPGSEGSRPVLFWIHGGALLTGSGTGLWTGGEKFARDHDVVIVTINYRLGALGFLVLDDPTTVPGVTSNNGLLDQMAALNWVRKNISAFGGDPSRVCIFGESAGAMSVATHLGSPASRGLFSSAVIQSGHHEFLQSLEASSEVTRRFLNLFDGLTGNPLEFLRGLDVSQIMGAQGKILKEMALPFKMVIDGHVVPRPIIDTVASGAASNVRLIVGTNTNENRLFSSLDRCAGVPVRTLEERLGGLLASEFVNSPVAAQFQTDLNEFYESQGYGGEEMWETLSNDRLWRAPVRELLDTFVGAGGTAFSYEFGFESPVRGGELKACHALEIPFVFNNLNQPGVTSFIGDDIGRDSSALKLSLLMNECWARFAGTGQPTESVAQWPSYGPADHQQMFFSDSSEVRSDPGYPRTSWLGDWESYLNNAWNSR